jgi:hypothetical protein
MARPEANEQQSLSVAEPGNKPIATESDTPFRLLQNYTAIQQRQILKSTKMMLP